MTPSPHVTVTIDLARVRAAAERAKREAGVDVYAVVKADAYGCGAAKVADAVAGAVDGFYLFTLAEARAAGVRWFGKPVIALLDESEDAAVYREAGVKPVVWTVARARSLRGASAIVSVDTGQQRFACAAAEVEAIVKAGEINEAMTHASRLEQARAFDAITRPLGLGYRHAAGTALLGEPGARFDAVRPGLALYADAVRVTTKLVDARRTDGPAGYGGFRADRHGVILAGYANGLRPGPCLVNGELRRVVEVGMQSAFVELDDRDKAGDEVVLLGDAITSHLVSTTWETSQQEVLVRMTALGQRRWT